VVIGAHLDSVDGGPGINDNGFLYLVISLKEKEKILW